MQRRRGMNPTRMKMLRTPSRRRKGVSPISRRKFVLPVTACLLMTSYKGLFYVFISLKNCFWFVLFQLQRRMKIAELKQICARPDVVEVVCLVQQLSIHLGSLMPILDWICFLCFLLYLSVQHCIVPKPAVNPDICPMIYPAIVRWCRSIKTAHEIQTCNFINTFVLLPSIAC